MILDHREPFLPKDFSWQRLCHRQEGVGADGVLLLERSEAADYRMRIFNADGSEAEMCGNGLRSLIDFIGESREVSVETRGGLYRGMRTEGGAVLSVPMPEEPWREMRVGSWAGTFLTVGVPHFVVFVEDVEAVDVEEVGAQLRRDPLFAPGGTNVDFVEQQADQIRLRTYERGVEGETLACGTGTVAAALVALRQRKERALTVEVRSGERLVVETDPSLTLRGPARLSFHGSFLLSDYLVR